MKTHRWQVLAYVSNHFHLDLMDWQLKFLVPEPVVVMLSMPFELIGGIWLIFGYGFTISVAVSVGFIALAGLAAEMAYWC